MFRFSMVVVLLASCSYAFGQQKIKDFIATSTLPLQSIDPENKNYSDFNAIGNAIGNARIVMLGEQDHGDAPTFLAKTRLVEFLHREKGFSVLAMESDFFALNDEGSNLAEIKQPIDTFLMSIVYGAWSNCDACQSLFRYVKEAFQVNNLLHVTGFDNQMYSSKSYNNLFRKLDSVLKYHQLPVTGSSTYNSEMIPLIKTLFQPNFRNDTATFVIRRNLLLRMKEELSSKVPAGDYWLMVIENLLATNEQRTFVNVDYWRSHNARDAQMARNLIWLSEVKYPDRKIIVWAHNAHISKYNGHFPEAFLNNAKRMGHVFTQDSLRMENTYIIGFTSGEGMAGRLGTKPYKLPKRSKDGYENWINPAYQQSFTDFKPFNKTVNGPPESFSLAGSVKTPSLHTVHTAPWTKIFDGVIFIRKMYPCTSIMQ